MSKRDYYKVLEVAREATPDQLKKSYRRLAMKYHPDQNPDDVCAEERFRDVVAAYELLAEGKPAGRLLASAPPLEGPQGCGYHMDNPWGYFLWWRESFF